VNIRIRSWSSRTFYDPEPVLREFRRLEYALADEDIPDLLRRLRTNGLKPAREGRDALIFAHGMATVVGAKVLVAPGETENCDFITRTTNDQVEHFACVQLKELAPADLSPQQTLATLVANLQKYAPSDSTLAVHLNRQGRIPFADLAEVRAPFSEVWFFWAADPEQATWYLYGGTPGDPILREFTYPA